MRYLNYLHFSRVFELSALKVPLLEAILRGMIFPDMG